MQKALWALSAAVVLCGCGGSPELKAVRAAADALGGKDKILAVKTLVIEGEGENSNLGQNVTPDAPLTVWKVTGYRQSINLEKGQMRVEQVRTAQFPFALATVVRQNTAVDGDIAWDVPETGDSSRLTERTAEDRRLALLRHPVTILRAALDPGAKLSNFRENGDVKTVDVTTADGYSSTLALDVATKLPLNVSATVDHPNLGDVVIQTSFSEYEDFDGLKLPKHIRTQLDKWPLSEIRVSKYTVNGKTADLAAPANIRAEVAAPENPPVEVTVEVVAPGIWWLAGPGNHHSVAFEFADHLTLFELPESEDRARAVIEKTHSLAFGKPLTEVIVSHPHFDHSAGLRVAVAEGLTIITQRGNTAFFKDLTTRKHTIVPDQLAKTIGAAPIRIRPVDDELVLKDASMELDLYHVKDNSHSDTMLMGWVPRNHILVQADLYDSGWLKFPWADNLKKNVAMRGLTVERDVPIHGKIESWADVLKTMQVRP